LLLVAGCASSAGGEGGEGSSGEDGLICPKCSAVGGETSDFGTVLQEPTACQASESPVPIDEESARALGFNEALERYSSSIIMTPYAWTATYPGGGQPAQGYSAQTTIRLEKSIASITHLVPSLAGCDDRLLVRLHISVSTADGAISVSGDIDADTNRSGTNHAFGRLDLANAQGSLKLTPPAWPNLVGYFALILIFEPQSLIGHSYVEMRDAGSVGTDSGRAFYRPLDGEFQFPTRIDN